MGLRLFKNRHVSNLDESTRYFLGAPDEVQRAYGLKVAEGYGTQQKAVMTAPMTLEPAVVVQKMDDVMRQRVELLTWHPPKVDMV